MPLASAQPRGLQARSGRGERIDKHLLERV